MASIVLSFTSPLNVSCQVGDTAYFAVVDTSGEFLVDNTDGIREIGQVRQINNAMSNMPSIVCDTEVAESEFGTSPFIMFGKDRSANVSTIIGYYAEIKFICTDTAEAELFAINVSIFETSK